jgi:hypothetical protein
MEAWMHGCMHAWMDEWMDGWIDGWVLKKFNTFAMQIDHAEKKRLSTNTCVFREHIPRMKSLHGRESRSD